MLVQRLMPTVPSRRVAARSFLACLLLAACSVANDATLSRAETRTPIELSAQERERMRAGMRFYLECIEGITGALGENKMSGVANSAKRCGMDMVDNVTFAEVLTLPPEFLALSLDTHQKFDVLAKEAVERTTRTSALNQLGAILTNCTGCHAAYRFAR
jgi:hypothetical protein